MTPPEVVVWSAWMAKGKQKKSTQHAAASTLNFVDLGLRTPMPSVLTQSREKSRYDKIQKKKEAKARMQQALEQVAATRVITARHKEVTAQMEAQERQRRTERKRELHVAHCAARNEREAETKRQRAENVAANVAYANKVRAERRAEAAASAQVRALLEEKEEAVRQTAVASVHVPIHRTTLIESVRRDLPVVREEQAIVEAINHAERSCVLICGETGSGKTTQIPQFLWEAGYGHAQGSALGRDGMILVTEPRRVAAVSMAKRVAEELNITFGAEVCYQVRYDNNLSDRCKLKFVTEGIVLNEIQSDFLLRQYSCIIVDEAHERSIACDILIGLLSRIAPLRNDMHREELARVGGDAARTTVKPLRLVIMSATLRVDDFRDNTRLFPIRPQLIDVEARRFKVTNHFTRRTEIKEYVHQAFDKVRQIHKKLPPGGILVFLCTQQEIESLCDQLRRYYARTRIEYYDNAYHKQSILRGEAADDTHNEQHGAAGSSDSDADGVTGRSSGARSNRQRRRDGTSADGESNTAVDVTHSDEADEFGLQTSDYALDADTGVARTARRSRAVEDLGERIPRRQPNRSAAQRTRHAQTAGQRGTERVVNNDDEPNEEEEEEDNADEADAHDEDDEVNGELNTLHVLPMYALLDFERQQEVFKPPPRNRRLCIVATNIAETSITIPNIRYVVDAGRVKSRTTDTATKASCFRIGWTSQASAEQRSGRAGRVGPGHCYRLYSTAVYTNLMPRYAAPEILRTPLEAVVLLMKHIGIDHVSNFPFPASPPLAELHTALIHLAALGALNAQRNYAVTRLGSELLRYPVAPRLARVLYEVQRRHGDARVTAMTMAIVALLSTTTNVFTSEGNRLKSTKPTVSASRPVQQGGGGDDTTSLTVVGSAALLSARGTDGGVGVGSAVRHDSRRAPHDPEEDAIRQRVKSLINHGTDLITFLNAFVAYLTERHACARYCLVQKNMYEAKLLYHQLQRLCRVRSATGAQCGQDHGADQDKALHDGVLQSLETNDSTPEEDGPWSSPGGSDRLSCTNITRTGDGVAVNALHTAGAGVGREGEKERCGHTVSLRRHQGVGDDGRLNAIGLTPTRADELALRQLFIVGMIDQVARRASVHECRTHGVEYGSRTTKVPYLILSTRTIAYVHPSSSISSTHPPPEYVIFAFLQRVVRSEAHPERTTMLGVTIVTLEWLHVYGFSEEHATTPMSIQEGKTV